MLKKLKLHAYDVILYSLVICLKGACSDPQPHPQTFFKHMEILMQEVESHLEGYVCEVASTKSL